jgi:hypothetical protein
MEHLVTKQASCLPRKTKQSAVIILGEDMCELEFSASF